MDFAHGQIYSSGSLDLTWNDPNTKTKFALLMLYRQKRKYNDTKKLT